MIIISHRGYWKSSGEKNSKKAFERSFSLGVGVELDIRDYQGQIVVSHDIADNHCVKLETVFQLYQDIKSDVSIALDIKADGLQQKLKELLETFRITNYFVFDMSLPDALIYLEYGLNTFTRLSEYEKEPLFFKKATGVWMDSFKDDWIKIDDIKFHLDNGKKVCLVSPELHRRDHVPFWKRLRHLDEQASRNTILCTDCPKEARRFFS